MLIRLVPAAALLALALAPAVAAQQAPAQPARPTLQQLLDASYDLQAVVPTTAPCGNQPANRTQNCRRELYFLQSPRKDIVYRCERGLWNGQSVTDCSRI